MEYLTQYYAHCDFILFHIFSCCRPAENVPPMPLNHRPSSTSPEEGRQLTDEELAWRLMQEEEAQFQQRMMALAGLGTQGSCLFFQL